MMLAEKLTVSIKDLTVLQINTDGVTIKVHEIYYDKVKEVCKWWMELTMLELEEVHYSKMIIRDVYIICVLTSLIDGKLLRA
jgi:hypothetical protein